MGRFCRGGVGGRLVVPLLGVCCGGILDWLDRE